jgi:hypothetical protein
VLQVELLDGFWHRLEAEPVFIGVVNVVYIVGLVVM